MVSVQLPQVTPNATYYLKVQGATRDSFGIGHYGLAVTFDGVSTTSPTTLAKVLRGDYQTLDNNAIDAILRNPSGAFFSNDKHSDDTLLSATTLAPSPNFAKETHYETTGEDRLNTDQRPGPLPREDRLDFLGQLALHPDGQDPP